MRAVIKRLRGGEAETKQANTRCLKLIAFESLMRDLINFSIPELSFNPLKPPKKQPNPNPFSERMNVEIWALTIELRMCYEHFKIEFLSLRFLPSEAFAFSSLCCFTIVKMKSEMIPYDFWLLNSFMRIAVAEISYCAVASGNKRFQEGFHGTFLVIGGGIVNFVNLWNSSLTRQFEKIPRTRRKPLTYIPSVNSCKFMIISAIRIH